MRHYGWIVFGALLVLWTGCRGGVGPDPGQTASVVIAPAADTLLALQDTLALSAEVRDGRGQPVAGAEVLWSTLEPSVATVDSRGRVVSRDVGTARIVATSGATADTATVSVITGVETSRLGFVRLSASAPPVATRDTSFWAVRGNGRRLEIRLRSTDPDKPGEEFFEFRVPGDALLRYPDGRSFARGDSVRIRVRVDETRRFLFTFEPSGLRFDPDHPAELRVRYRHAEEVAREDSLFLWKQEQPGALWLRILTLRVKDADEARAEITSFTAFSLGAS